MPITEQKYTPSSGSGSSYYYGSISPDTVCKVDLVYGAWNETYSAYGAPNAFFR